MKTLFGAVSALALFASGTACAQPAPAPATAVKDADPALWVVKDADTTIYLFGTVHVLKPGLSWFDEGVKDAFDKSQEVVLEIVEPEPAAMQQIVMKYAIDPDGPPLTQKLSEADRADYVKAMEGLGLQAAQFEPFKPWMAGLTLAVLPLAKYGYDPEQGSEKIISAEAKKTGKPIGQLETVEQQMGFFDSLSEADQIAFLNATVDGLPEYETMLGTMVESWAAGDPDRLGVLMTEAMTETPTLAKVLLEDRNARWATWIDQRLDKPGTVFVAVGSGHLAGKGSVQDKLKALKIDTVRVKY